MIDRSLIALALVALTGPAAAEPGRTVPHPGSGFGTFAAPGQAVPGPRAEPARALPHVRTAVDPTNKVDAVEYLMFLEGFRLLRAGKSFGELDEAMRKSFEKLAVTEESWRHVQVLTYRDDPVYVIDESKPMGPVKTDARGAPVRDVPVLEVVPVKLPKRGNVHPMLVKPRPFFIEGDKPQAVFRVLLPMYGRKPDGAFATAPHRYLRLAKLPEAGARTIVAPVDATGQPGIVALGQTGGAVAPADLARGSGAEGDELVAYDNRTAPRLPPDERDMYVFIVDLSELAR
jgi:hypothetical protein